jgi:hypothetical protein
MSTFGSPPRTDFSDIYFLPGSAIELPTSERCAGTASQSPLESTIRYCR